MFDLMNEEVEVKDKSGAVELQRSSVCPEIKFDEVDFCYELENPVLRNVSFTVAPGTTTAIVGSSGSGKTTIGKLLVRLYDCTAGTIRFDGVSVSELSLASVRSRVGVVPQDTVLFNDTIRYNIRYGRMDATDSVVVVVAYYYCIFISREMNFNRRWRRRPRWQISMIVS